jgi:hypothetical protein
VILSQSTVKSFESADCYRKWYAEHTGEIPRFVSEPMTNGSYFEYLCLGGGSGKSGDITSLPTLQNGKKSVAQLRIEQQAEKFKSMFDPSNDQFTGWYIKQKQLYLSFENKEGTIDFTVEREEFRLADLKLTADLETEYSYWSNPQEIDHLQPSTYTWLYTQNFEFTNKFDYWVYDYSPKMNVLNVEVTVSDEALYQMEKRFSEANHSIMEYQLLDEFPRIPSIKACRYCKVSCDKRINKSNYNQISIVI